MVLTLVAQAQSKLEGVLSGIGCAGVGESLEWELPSDEEEQEQSSELRSTEEWKQYVATYGQSYTERYFASYYHSQVNICPHSSFGWPRCVICIFICLVRMFALFAASHSRSRCCPYTALLPPSTISSRTVCLLTTYSNIHQHRRSLSMNSTRKML
jgi:hypothetical protein